MVIEGYIELTKLDGTKVLLPIGSFMVEKYHSPMVYFGSLSFAVEESYFDIETLIRKNKIK